MVAGLINNLQGDAKILLKRCRFQGPINVTTSDPLGRETKRCLVLAIKFLPANSSGLLSLFVLVFICNTSVYADFGHRNETRLNQSTSAEVFPVNLEILTLVELLELRKQHHSQLRSLQTKSDTPHASEQKLLERLLAYDNVRLKIVDVIKSLIDEYKVRGEIPKKIIGVLPNVQHKNSNSAKQCAYVGRIQSVRRSFCVGLCVTGVYI